MVKKNKLYTVNRWNKPMFMPRENLFYDGGTEALAKADYKENPWNYSQDYIYGNGPSITEQYANSTNAFGISKADNPFSKMNLQGGFGAMAKTPIGGALISSAAGAIGGLANNAISGGLKSGAGSAISGIGSTVGSAVGAVNPVAGAIVSLGSQVIGGLTNRAFGTKVDQEKLNNVNASISNLNNFTSNASSFDAIKGPTAVSTDTNAYKGGWFSGSKARKKNRELQARLTAAKDWADRSVENNIFNLVSDQTNDALANYAAYGGPLGAETLFQHSGQVMNDNNDMGAIEYGFISDYLTNKRQQAEQKNQLNNLFMGTPSTMFDFGGDLQAHGGDYGTGLTHIDAGNSHEENPYDGVQMGVDREGTPNLVEEGETVYDDYVFSNRIKCDATTKEKFHLPKKKEITYAEVSKKLEKEIAERPNDPVSLAGFKAQMQALEEQQERQKQEMEAERAKAAFEALSPEEQREVLSLLEKQEAQAAMAEQAAQEQQIAEGAQLSPEEAVMRQQGAGMESQAMDGTIMQQEGAPQMMQQAPMGIMEACGGKINKFSGGGKIKDAILDYLNIHTPSDYAKWAKDNDIPFKYDDEDWDWDMLRFNNKFMEALNKKDPTLAHALSNNYDFGLYKPDANRAATIQSISRGNWKETNGKGWKGSEDLAYKQAVAGMTDAEVDTLTTEQLAALMRNTEAYKNTSKWLHNADNALLYMNTLLNDPNTPEVAKEYARKFINDGKWKDGFAYDYDTVFGSNGVGVRETNPGTYWHSVVEANRGNQAKNFVRNTNGEWEEIRGAIPEGWNRLNSYSWDTPDSAYTYTYYQRPDEEAQDGAQGDNDASTEGTDGRKVVPIHRNENLRYAGLFGPAVGLGMQAMGIGKPDYSRLDAVVDRAGNVHLAGYKPLGNYLRYRPMDIWFEQNRMDANSRATDRAIMNSSSPSRMTGLVANGYNTQLADGELYRKALEYNDANRERVAAFNRGTDQFNAQAYNQNQQFNADALNRAGQYRAGLAMQAAQDRLSRDAGWYNSLYGNVSGLFKGLSDLGRENAQWNMVADMAADGLFGNLGDSYVGRRHVKTERSKGGKVRRKKGLTF